MRVRPAIGGAFLAIGAAVALMPLARGREWLGWLIVVLVAGGEGTLTFVWCRDALREAIQRWKKQD